ncbi:MAG: 2-oxo acid dehydrogenase subunit E2, partial [Planctomycetota bacterium]
NKLLPDDFDGANMVLTGLGMYGIESFYAISPPSATGILSIGNIEEAVVPIDGNFEVRRMMYAALAFDQRVVDEFYAAAFLKMIRKLLENPTAITGE